MRIAILADSHDHYENLRKAVDLANEYKCELMLHAGDLGAPGKCVTILSKFEGEVKMVIGNNDHELIGLMRKTASVDNFELIKTSAGGDSYEEEINGIKIFMHHYPRISKLAALSGEFDLCVFGHTHTYYEKIINSTLLINPSSIHPEQAEASFVIYDTKLKQAERVML
ncbi:YfcE family phosphodiesterase [Candidatus Campbellbacteria bacterium]|nr:YfcE family phosphodiesterase [Candidatus Campbellbacteria bacterium]|tara:strand:+ start:2165 stop:2671 length:507 start_codon:yes stop_codon:yes gene_type:complete